MCKQETLTAVALQGSEDAELLFGLDSLCNHCETQGVRKPDYRGNDGALVIYPFEIADERSVDLDEVERELSQVCERRIAGTKVVQTNLDASFAKRPKPGH